ncbi:3-hexulose-6-phosphate synthase [Falsibacillus albus]|uniref:3-hexulose-6-phosphate synthase n=1 Tax=Falsibacillus albus TaxID=2478915 RepID=A0A3L7JSE9_9BACI|nr:3-hexulose-6-phosphate synthase [Falsibacillus albus]RLQ93807.1 3-hexulose-6-phosphate synthase [Falsibacillus albus]
MKIQLALDRLSIEEAISIAAEVEESIDWIEVGTSLIKEFGMRSVKELKEAFPHKTIVADIKTMDNANYEAELCFEAGADVMTVMGAASASTIEACISKAKEYGKEVMIDLLNVAQDQKQHLAVWEEAILCEHVSKDDQELSGKKNDFNSSVFLGKRLAVAGGITEQSMQNLSGLKPEVVIIGSAITKSENKKEAALRLKTLCQIQEVSQ